ncbi:hypothetical protein [Cobetia amphilecti]|uniref:hypothetical protein n=1 Tax=Cobetia amphilecti TaxID=1055104 RepID=UPI00254BEE2E|nr:hypothetical protein [Cobetia amphilecti]
MSHGVVFNNNNGPVEIVQRSIVRRSSIIGKLIEILAMAEPPDYDLARYPADISNKISFNDLSSSGHLLNDYIDNSLLMTESIRQLNKDIVNGDTKLKRQMKIFYHDALFKYHICLSPFNIEELRKNSNLIVQNVIEDTQELVRNSSDLQDGYYEEDIIFGVNVIVAYSIIDCIVMENPNDHN